MISVQTPYGLSESSFAETLALASPPSSTKSSVFRSWGNPVVQAYIPWEADCLLGESIGASTRGTRGPGRMQVGRQAWPYRARFTRVWSCIWRGNATGWELPQGEIIKDRSKINLKSKSNVFQCFSYTWITFCGLRFNFNIYTFHSKVLQKSDVKSLSNYPHSEVQWELHLPSSNTKQLPSSRIDLLNSGDKSC